MATPHNKAEFGDIAQTVLMPGDPLRAKVIAETFLENPVQFNHVRNMFGFTGLYKGHKISVMGSGMGIPSIGLYAYELYKFYGVENIVRVGSTGTYKTYINIYDTILVKAAYSDSTYAKSFCGDESHFQYPDPELNEKLKSSAKRLGIDVREGNVWSSDVFYFDDSMNERNMKVLQENDIICAEMESFGLFATAKHLHRKAACMLTVSDNIVTHVETTSEERQSKLMDMVRITLDALVG